MLPVLVLAELTFTDQHIPQPSDPVAPAQRSRQAKTKDASKHNHDGLPVYRYRDLLTHLSTLDSFTCQRRRSARFPLIKINQVRFNWPPPGPRLGR